MVDGDNLTEVTEGSSSCSQFDGLAFSLSPSPPHPVIDRCDVEFCVDSDFFVGIKKKIARGFSPPAI
jgi:hypothetical protein